jgi:2-dehydro-3-deoxyphosphogluconate aldolase/(4S)-4-hydroxy-2-oxoglutarate aldolase
MNFQEKSEILCKTLGELKIVPVLVLNNVDDGLKMCEILAECGLPGAEITFRTSAAQAVIKAASERFPDFCIGAGTVLNTEDLHRAFDAGAKFAVAPGFNPVVVQEAINNDFVFAPGVCTPREAEQAMALGCRFLKFFPAEAAGGVKMIKSIIAPYKHLGIRFMPTGGVSTSNVADYLAVKEIVAVGGTWLGKSADIEAGNWQTIRDTVREAVELKNSL